MNTTSLRGLIARLLEVINVNYLHKHFKIVVVSLPQWSEMLKNFFHALALGIFFHSTFFLFFQEKRVSRSKNIRIHVIISFSIVFYYIPFQRCGCSWLHPKRRRERKYTKSKIFTMVRERKAIIIVKNNVCLSHNLWRIFWCKILLLVEERANNRQTTSYRVCTYVRNIQKK